MELRRVSSHPAGGSITIFEPSGKGVFGSEAVVDDLYQAACPPTQASAHDLVSVQVARAPAFLKEYQDGEQTCASFFTGS
jgi:hypothetical protein